jgi:hypothetical protein
MKQSEGEKQRTRQIGEYLVAIKLMEHGWYATTFTGNMPLFDIIATNDESETVIVQVKAKRRGDWQLDMKKFVEIKFDVNGVQAIGELIRLPSNLYYVLVKLDSDIMRSTFYVVPSQHFQSYLVKRYQKWLEEISGRRTDNPKSTHSALGEWEVDKYLKDYENNWSIIHETALHDRYQNPEVINGEKPNAKP